MKEKINLVEVEAKRKKAAENMKLGRGTVEDYRALGENEKMLASGEIEESAREDYENWQKKRADLAEQVKKAVLERNPEDKKKIEAELKALDAEYYGESKEGFENKSILKKGYYYEFRPFFDSLPEELPVPKNVVETKNDKTMTEKEMTKGHEFFSEKEAFGLACKNKKEGKDGLIWFKDDAGALCDVSVGGGGSGVSVRRFDADDEWGAGGVSCFRN